jgi:hypothetical protein
MVLLKGVDKDGFVWFVSITVIVVHTVYNIFLKMLVFSYLLLLYAGTPIMIVERHMNYLIIPMHLCFSTGTVLIDRLLFYSVFRIRIK